jgi:hypothetical protein
MIRSKEKKNPVNKNQGWEQSIKSRHNPKTKTKANNQQKSGKNFYATRTHDYKMTMSENKEKT